jgi:hypothetical protein
MYTVLTSFTKRSLSYSTITMHNDYSRGLGQKIYTVFNDPVLISACENFLNGERTPLRLFFTMLERLKKDELRKRERKLHATCSSSPASSMRTIC